ncbi:MAG: HU family DNA-binding protein [Parabacteroides merdae]
MSKDAASGATLYHAQTSITKKLTLNKICTRIENICTASRGEIILVLDGLIKVMNEALSDGESVRLGGFGSFRMVCRQQRFGHRRRFHHRPVQPCPHRLLPRHDARSTSSTTSPSNATSRKRTPPANRPAVAVARMIARENCKSSES